MLSPRSSAFRGWGRRHKRGGIWTESRVCVCIRVYTCIYSSVELQSTSKYITLLNCCNSSVSSVSLPHFTAEETVLADENDVCRSPWCEHQGPGPCPHVWWQVWCFTCLGRDAATPKPLKSEEWKRSEILIKSTWISIYTKKKIKLKTKLAKGKGRRVWLAELEWCVQDVHSWLFKHSSRYCWRDVQMYVKLPSSFKTGTLS